MGRVGALLEIARPGNVSLAAAAATVGGLAAAGRAPHVDALALAAAAASLGVAGGNALNDALDATIDRGAHPNRPVARGDVTAPEALWWGATLLAAALLAALAAGFWVVLLATLLAGNLLLYEFALKTRGLLGHVFVSYNAGAIFLLGGLASVAPALGYGGDAVVAVVTDPRIVPPLVMAVLAAFLNFGRELYKAAEDAPHDASTRATFAVRHGARHARALAGAATLAVIPLALAPRWLGLFGDLYVWTLSPLLLLLAAVPFVGAPSTARALLKFGMVLGLLPFLAIALI